MDKVSLKVPGGKLIQVEAEFKDDLEQISITGDFFIEPPEALEKIEGSLIGLSKDFTRSDVVKRVSEIDADLIGFAPEHIAECLEEVVSE